MRRRSLHRALAEALEAAGAPSREVARHWLGARAGARAREALLRAAAESEAVHAYRDAAAAGRQALELWPEGGDEDRRGEALERYARCSQPGRRAGRGRARVARARRPARRRGRRARAGATRSASSRRCTSCRGDREAAFAARRAAADGLRRRPAARPRPPSSSSRWPTSAAWPPATARRSSWRGRARAEAEARRPARPADPRASGSRASRVAKHGDYEGGLETVRGGLALALEHDLTAVAAELYQRLSVTLYDSADYRRAEEALDTALAALPRQPGRRHGGRVRDVHGLRAARARRLVARRRDVPRADRRAAPPSSSPRACSARSTPSRASSSSARRLLTSSLATAVAPEPLQHDRRHDVGARARRGRARATTTRPPSAAARSSRAGRTATTTTTPSAASAGAAAFFAARGDRDGAHACAEALTRIASETGHADALAALAHAIAETALLEGDADTAAEQLSRAVELHRELDMPFERAQIELRAGVALAAAGERELALERLVRRLPHAPASSARGRWPPRRRARSPRSASRSCVRLGSARRRRRRRRRAVAARARGRPPARGRPHEPRDRAGPVPQPAHGRHARAQHPAQARLPLARRGRRPRARAGADAR